MLVFEGTGFRYMRSVSVAVALMLFTVTASAKPFTMFGVGSQSCASWLATPASEFQGTAWIVGFWSGANYAMASNDTGGQTGDSTDGLGLIGEVKRLCQQHPSESLVKTTINVFQEFAEKRK